MAHSHPHPHPHPHPPQQQQGPQPGQAPFVPPPVDPAILALIEADYKPVKLTLGPPNDSQALCELHAIEKCDECGVDFTTLNALAKVFVTNPNFICPPPPNVIQPQRSQAVTKTKDEGNALYKAQKHTQAISIYTMAASVASQRVPWEASQLMKEELATVLSNRSAAYVAAGDPVAALVDADIVVQLKRPWSKGHFRKAKALVELGRFEEAKEAIQLGLAFEPSNSELLSYVNEINRRIEKLKVKASK